VAGLIWNAFSGIRCGGPRFSCIPCPSLLSSICCKSYLSLSDTSSHMHLHAYVPPESSYSVPNVERFMSISARFLAIVVAQVLPVHELMNAHSSPTGAGWRRLSGAAILVKGCSCARLVGQSTTEINLQEDVKRPTRRHHRGRLCRQKFRDPACPQAPGTKITEETWERTGTICLRR
jgi:hypothetical protein